MKPKLYPMMIRPCYKEYLWGGSRLKTRYGKSDGPDILAESWELADHKDGNSIIADGPMKGMTLQDLRAIDKEQFWGRKCECDKFPILVKFIDAFHDLSVQIHPSDIQAKKELGESGKAEMWYIIDCTKEAFIYLGLQRGISENEFIKMANDGSICDVLNRVEIHKGDVFFIEPGIIHAIGAGALIAEIQQNSNTTFRIYDYQRKDKNGNQRELHLDRAIEVSNLEPIIPSMCRSTGTMIFPEFIMTEMYVCEMFKAYKVDIHQKIELNCNGESFHHITCVEGNGVIGHNSVEYPLQRGKSYFMPATIGDYSINGKCEILLSRV